MRGLFSFPNPVNETSARLVAGVVAVLAVVAIAFQQGWILPVLAYGFLARALTGPKLSPLALVAKRFAQSIGAVFTVTATLLWYAAGQHTAALALAGVIALFASLESGLGLCVGCKAFYLGMRLGLVPPSVCEDCAPFISA
jgi:hypothetical protein